MTARPHRRRLGANVAIGHQLEAAQPGPQAIIDPSVAPSDRARPTLHPQASLQGRQHDEAAARITSNSISLPDELWEALRRAAHARRRRLGGRTSVSALIRELLERHRDDWTTDAPI